MPSATDTSVYVHFPWCLKKCPYCDFSSFATARDAVPHAAYADGVLRELADRQPGAAGLGQELEAGVDQQLVDVLGRAGHASNYTIV